MPNEKKQILLIITASVAAYKALDLIRSLKDLSIEVTTILTSGAKSFVTPLSVGALSGKPVYDELFSLKDEMEIGHIKLAREADLVLVAPATADIMGKMAQGLADDLASTILLATDKPVLFAPAMNPVMWGNKAVQRNVEQLQQDGVHFIGPAEGRMACGEVGPGRLVNEETIINEIKNILCLKD